MTAPCRRNITLERLDELTHSQYASSHAFMTPRSTSPWGYFKLLAPVEVLPGNWESWGNMLKGEWSCGACGVAGGDEWLAVHSVAFPTVFCCSAECAQAMAARLVVEGS